MTICDIPLQYQEEPPAKKNKKSRRDHNWEGDAQVRQEDPAVFTQANPARKEKPKHKKKKDSLTGGWPEELTKNQDSLYSKLKATKVRGGNKLCVRQLFLKNHLAKHYCQHSRTFIQLV